MRRARKTSDPKVAIGYLRVSTEEQHLGPEAQRAAIKAWAKQESVRVAAWHMDKGVSGARELDDRPGLMMAIGELRRRGAGVLVVARRDRLARSVEVVVAIERAVRNARAVVASADGRNDDGPSGKLVRQIEDAIAEHERALVSSRTKGALAIMRRRGLRMGGVNYGFRPAPPSAGGPIGKTSKQPLKLVPDAREQRVCALVAQLREQGATEQAIVRELALRDVRSRRGGLLNQTQVHKILHNLEKLRELFPSHARRSIQPMPACERGHVHKASNIGKLCLRGVCKEWHGIDDPSRRIEWRDYPGSGDQIET